MALSPKSNEAGGKFNTGRQNQFYDIQDACNGYINVNIIEVIV